ncbi:MoaD/ThiS family protein [Streptomyces albulus]|nr:MoaD/ThiS family protein [Streptomyces noursei]
MPLRSSPYERPRYARYSCRPRRPRCPRRPHGVRLRQRRGPPDPGRADPGPAGRHAVPRVGRGGRRGQRDRRAAHQWSTTALGDGDRVEVLTAVQGG